MVIAVMVAICRPLPSFLLPLGVPGSPSIKGSPLSTEPLASLYTSLGFPHHDEVYGEPLLQLGSPRHGENSMEEGNSSIFETPSLQ